MNYLTSMAKTIVVVMLMIISNPAAAQTDSLNAFKNFVASANYKSADFYLTNGFVTAESVDSAQLFYSVLMGTYEGDTRRNAFQINRLYEYLARLGTIDLNRGFACTVDREDRNCLLLNRLVHLNTRPTEMAWYVARGLDLNQRRQHFVPATLPLIIRLATNYSLTDLNWFVANGMVLGDESYSLEELINYRDEFLYYQSGRKLWLPGNYLNLGDQNFLDVLVAVLATPTRNDGYKESQRRKVLCDFITHAATAYTPSYDYLLHVLESVDEFRGGNIGNQVRKNGGIYQPFPTSCVLLVQAMAASHAHLDEVISSFAGSGDVSTANWLISIKQSRG